MVYPIAKKTLLPFVRIFIKETHGLENIPTKGPYIIACKHVGSLDGVFIASVIIPKIDQKIYFVSNVAEWGWLWEKKISEQWAGTISFSKNNPSACLDVALDYLKKGRIVGIFPEGILQDKINNNGKIKTGTARLAIWSKVPIIPIGLNYSIHNENGLENMDNRWHVIGHTLRNPHSISINIGQPFEISEYYNQELNSENLHEAMYKIMDKINSLTKIIINN